MIEKPAARGNIMAFRMSGKLKRRRLHRQPDPGTGTGSWKL